MDEVTPKPSDEAPQAQDAQQPAKQEEPVAKAAEPVVTKEEPAAKEEPASRKPSEKTVAQEKPGIKKTERPEDKKAKEEEPPEKHWYVIHTQTGQELKVKSSLETRVEQFAATELISQVLVPTERVSEIRGGKKRISERKFFPGYILIEMSMTDENWHLVRTTPGVTGFIGAGRRPIPLSDQEVGDILRQTEERKEKPTPRVTFTKGEGVRVTEGPFANFNGVLEEVNTQRGKLKVMVSIFGRQTPVELEFWQVERF